LLDIVINLIFTRISNKPVKSYPDPKKIITDPTQSILFLSWTQNTSYIWGFSATPCSWQSRRPFETKPTYSTHPWRRRRQSQTGSATLVNVWMWWSGLLKINSNPMCRTMFCSRHSRRFSPPLQPTRITSGWKVQHHKLCGTCSEGMKVYAVFSRIAYTYLHSMSCLIGILLS